ncbi:hypothetical protein AB9E28_35620, partial [Rhizobium leguminosarum]
MFSSPSPPSSSPSSSSSPASPAIALYLLNHKRQTIVDYEARFGVAIIIDAD